MNTQIAHKNLFSSKEEYLAFIQKWKALARAKQLTAVDCLIRAILLGQDLDKVMPVTRNETRLANGAAKNSGRVHALAALRSCDPVKQEARRLQLVQERQMAGQPVPNYLAVSLWCAKWVDASRPESYERGLSAAQLTAVASAAGGLPA